MIGAVVGGVAGGLLGNGVAARGVREEGRILGAVVGAVAGSEVGRRNVDCNTAYYGPSEPPVYDATYRYEDRLPPPQDHRRRNVVNEWPARDDDLYGASDDAAIRQCQTVSRVTYLPDGREIHEPATACREMQYGDWDVESEQGRPPRSW